MVYAHHCPLPEQPSQQQHQQPPPCTDGDAGAVDLRLAESYTPLCLCLIKCTLVVACHSLLAPAQAHVLCISALALDRVCAHACERVVDTNAVAWGLLATFLMVSGATTPGASAPLHGAHHHLPHHVAALFGLWMVLSSVHLLHGGVPGLHGTPSTAFLSGLREPCSAPLPRHEVIACILTAMAMLVVCDPGIRTVVFLRDMDGLSGGLSGNSSWDVVWCIGARGAAYATLSCTWSYTIVVLSASRHGAASSGHSIARSTAVLTTTRFMIVFYVPAWAMGPWSTMAMAWMLWVCARHRAMRSHPKRTEDEEERGGRAPAAPVQQQQQQCSYHHHHHHPPRPQHPRQGLAAAPRPAHPVHLLPDPPPPAPLPLACMEVDRGVGQGGSGGDGGGGVREKVVGVGVETVEDNDHGVLQALQAAKAQHQQKAEASLRLF